MTQAYLYKWTHLPTNKWYIGSKTSKGCHPNDGYLCSSVIVKPMLQESTNDWSREILVIGNPQDIRLLEGQYLTALNAQHDDMSFNRHNATGKFHRTGIAQTEKTKKLLSDINTGKKHTLETCKKMSDSRTIIGGGFFGKPCSEETKKLLSDINTGKTRDDETRQKISKTLTGTHRPETVKNKIAMSVKNLPKICCIVCHTECSPANFGHWHGARCKLIGK